MADQLNSSWQIDHSFNLIHICQIICLSNTLLWSSARYGADQVSCHKYIIRLIQVKFKHIFNIFISCLISSASKFIVQKC